MPKVRSDELPETLLDCHLRLRQVTAAAGALAAKTSAPVDEVQEAATKVHRYFTVALPLHEEDEERSLFPRLLARVPALAPTIARLREGHGAHSARVGAVVALCRELQTWPERFPTLRSELASAATALTESWEAHLSLEEADLFPPVIAGLTAGDREAIRDEMRARRANLPR
jgi:iron-sulfur cluster repair protein YtfE (RIC family)